MCTKILKIAVAGDVTIDNYIWKRHSYSNKNLDAEEVDWLFYDGLNVCSQPGGSVLISQILNNSNLKPTISIVDQWNETQKWMNDNDRILHTNMYLDRFPPFESGLSNDRVLHTNICSDCFSLFKSNSSLYYRNKNFLGYTTPPQYNKNKEHKYPDPLNISNDSGDEDLVIIHDVGNGYRFKSNVWPKAIKNENKKPIIIYYMNPPLFRGLLWDKIKKHEAELILIINAENLREMGINISKSLSWEKTTLDFWNEIVSRNGKLRAIKSLKNVIIRFGLEGAIHYKGKDNFSDLYFDPSSIEGEFWDRKKFGYMRGLSTIFVSAFTYELISSFKEDIEKRNISDNTFEKCIKLGLYKVREFMKIGHGCGDEPVYYDKISEYLFNSNNLNNINDHIEKITLPFNKVETEKTNWTILESGTNRNSLKNVAIDIVHFGSKAIKNFPAGKFGDLITVSREEIESFRSIMNIMKNYVNSEKTSRPLSIAVFGDPGSGKSYGITQIAKSIDPNNIRISFNISQFTSPSDLNTAFHGIRDISLKGKIPLVFLMNLIVNTKIKI